ncbi:P-loop NTPase fold protein [Hyphomicrobium sp. MC1]|uniref:KAP family P-loop NTPase fold protein n=1 Tax=Hyphomicrobium sp. (strain MC1) TaxID=717785 RepID=UPI0002F8A695|nr:P-loop NTPase fold protein [Hyphomicrobium sp. MC1]
MERSKSCDTLKPHMIRSGANMNFKSWLGERLRRTKQQESQPDNLSADVPIKSHPDDIFRRSQFVARITEVLLYSRAREGRVFAIRGDWGSGKTSLKNLIVEQLQKQSGKADWLEFNPWQWGSSEKIARALFSQMAAKLGGAHSSKAQSRARALRKYAAILSGVAQPLKDAKSDFSDWLVIAALVATSAGLALPQIAGAAVAPIFLVAIALIKVVVWVLNYLGRDQSNESLDAVRTDLEDRLAKSSRPLIVFVDDIDRLQPKEIRVLFRQIKANANLPNIIFVLLYQQSIVERALNPVAGKNGRAYLEKIVQANFDLPLVPQSKIYSFFTESLQAIIGDLATEANGFEQVRWGNVFIGGVQPYLRNLRDAKRLLSSLSVLVPLYRGKSAFEVNIIDLCALETLRLFEQETYASLPLRKSLLLQSHRFTGDRRDTLDKAEMQSLIERSRADDRQAVKDILKELFPRAAWTIEGPHYGEEWLADWTKAKRVCSPRMFDRYFELQVSETTVSESDFAEFVASSANASDLREVVANLQARGILDDLAVRMDGSVESLPIENIAVLLPEIFDIGEKLSREADSVFDSGFLHAWRAASWYLNRLRDLKTRGHIFIGAMRATDSLAVAATLISIELEARKKREGANSESQRIGEISDADLEAAKSLWVEKFTHRLATLGRDVLLKDKNLVSFLYRWAEFSGDESSARQWISTATDTDSGLAKLIVRFMSVGSSHAMGDKVSRRTENFDRAGIEKFFDLTVLNTRMQKLDITKLDDQERRAASILQKSLRSWLSDYSDDLTSSSDPDR